MSLTPGIQRLCLRYAHAERLIGSPATYERFEDDEFLRSFIARYMSVGGLRNHYTAGSLTLDEFETCVDLVVRSEVLEHSTT